MGTVLELERFLLPARVLGLHLLSWLSNSLHLYAPITFSIVHHQQASCFVEVLSLQSTLDLFASRLEHVRLSIMVSS